MNWEIEFYQKENGEIPVESFLLSLSPKLRAKAYSDIVLLHGYVKKTNKMSEKEVEKALSYKVDYERRCRHE